jgi:hypothetical protein
MYNGGEHIGRLFLHQIGLPEPAHSLDSSSFDLRVTIRGGSH